MSSSDKHQSPEQPSGLSYDHEAIAALASGSGGAIAVIRVSGSQLLEKVCPQFIQKNPATVQNRVGHYVKVVAEDGLEIDDVMFSYFPAPHSFTGEDVIEISCHGGTYIIDRILSELRSRGIRQAEAGEFTKRALLNGKLDLTSAEGIKELVTAQTEGEWIAARQLATGRLSELVGGLRQKVVKAMAYVEATIDFPDEGDTKNVNLSHAMDQISSVEEGLRSLIDGYDSGRIMAQGLRVAIIGPPNAGKSTLMNYLLNQERAIVTEIAGTTRDFIEEKCQIKGRLVRLVDTAGIRETLDKVEQIGVEASKKILEDSDLCLFLIPAYISGEEEQTFSRYWQQLPQDRFLKIATKSDLHSSSIGFEFDLRISCEKDEGLVDLKEKLVHFIDSHQDKVSQEPFLTNERQKQLVSDARDAIQRFRDQLEEGLYEECLAFELQEVSDSLHNIIGRVDNEDVLDKVFSEFCIGK